MNQENPQARVPKPSRALYVLHRVFIIVAMVFGAGMVFWGFGTQSSAGDSSRVIIGVVGGVFAVGLGVYLRWFLRKTAG